MENDNAYEGHSRRGFFRWVILALLVILVVGLVASVLFFNGPYMMGTTPYYYYPHPFYMFFFFPLGFLVFFFVIFFVFRMAFWPWRRPYYYGRWRHWDYADDILRQRYARGEITKDQFEQMQKDLEQHRP